MEDRYAQALLLYDQELFERLGPPLPSTRLALHSGRSPAVPNSVLINPKLPKEIGDNPLGDVLRDKTPTRSLRSSEAHLVMSEIEKDERLYIIKPLVKCAGGKGE